LLEALALIKEPIELHLRGHCTSDYKDFLQLNFPRDKGHSLYIHSLVSMKNSFKASEHDIGLTLEQYTPASAI
jgi:hypothetical protein